MNFKAVRIYTKLEVVDKQPPLQPELLGFLAFSKDFTKMIVIFKLHQHLAINVLRSRKLKQIEIRLDGESFTQLYW